MGDVAYPPSGLEARGVRLRFGAFELDLRSGEIWKAGTLLKLPPQPFRILALLAQSAGVVITREQIRQHIWGDGTVVDFDQRLNACINQIRSVLGDDAELPRFVETLPRRGYRWVGPAAEASDSADVVPFPHAEPAEPLRGRVPVPRLGSRAWSLVLVSALTALAAAVAYQAGTRRGQEPTWTRLTFQRGAVAGGRFAPSGEVLYGAEWEGRPCALHSVVPGSPDPRRLRDDGCSVVGVSPQGELAFLTDVPRGTLAQASIAGGPAKERRKGLTAADWSRDGSTFALAYFVPGRTQMAVEWPAGQVIGSVDNPSHLRISPDGRHLALLEHPVVGDDRGRVVLFDRAGTRRALTREWQGAEGLAWGPDGREVWFTASEPGSGAALYAASLSGRLRRLLPPDRQLVLLDVAPDGRALVDRGDLRQEVLFSRAGEPERNLSWLDMTSVVAISADGTLLLNETGAGGGPGYGVYLRRGDGSLPVRLGNGRGTALSPDGRFVMTIPIRERDRIDVVPTGAGEARTIRDDGIVGYEWSFFFPDGKRTLFVGKEAGGAMRLFVRDLAGGRPRAIAPENVRAQKVSPISPDGGLVVARCLDGDYCLYPVDGGEPRRVAGAGGLRPLAWHASGQSLLMLDRSLKFPLALYRLDLASGRRELWKTLSPPDPAGVSRVTGVAVNPDWSAYAYDYMRRLSELYVVDGLTGVRSE